MYRQALEVDPAHAPSLLGLGQLEARSGNPVAALEVRAECTGGDADIWGLLSV